MKQLVSQINKYNQIHFLIKTKKLEEAYRAVENIKFKSGNWLCVVLNLYAEISSAREDTQHALDSLIYCCDMEVDQLLICVSECNLIEIYLRLKNKDKALSIANKTIQKLQKYLQTHQYSEQTQKLNKAKQLLGYIYIIFACQNYSCKNIDRLKEFYVKLKNLNILNFEEGIDEMEKLKVIQSDETKLNKNIINALTNLLDLVRNNVTLNKKVPKTAQKNKKNYKIRTNMKKSNTTNKIIAPYLKVQLDTKNTLENFSPIKRAGTPTTQRIQKQRRMFFFESNPIYKQSLDAQSIFKAKKVVYVKTVEPNISKFDNKDLKKFRALKINPKQKFVLSKLIEEHKKEKQRKKQLLQQKNNDVQASDPNSHKETEKQQNNLKKSDVKEQKNATQQQYEMDKISQASKQDIFDVNNQLQKLQINPKVLQNVKIVKLHHYPTKKQNCNYIFNLFLEQIQNEKKKNLMNTYIWLLKKCIEDNYGVNYIESNNAMQIPKLANVLVEDTRQKYKKQVNLQFQLIVSLSEIFFKWLEVNEYSKHGLKVNQIQEDM